MKVRIEYKNIGKNRFCETKIYSGNKKFIVEIIYEELSHHLISKNVNFNVKDLFDLGMSDVFGGFYKVGEIYLR